MSIIKNWYNKRLRNFEFYLYMFPSQHRNINENYTTVTENMIADFIYNIGFLVPNDTLLIHCYNSH